MTRALLLIALGACFTSPPPYNKTADIEGCQALAVAQCMLHDRCTDGFQSIRNFGDQATCEQRTGLICIDVTEMRDTGQTVDQLATCAAQTTNALCNVFFEDSPPPDCDVTGLGAVGDPCGVNGECRAGFCQIANDAVCGTCQQKPQIGDTCMFTGDCGHGLACARPPTAPIGTCAAWVEQTGHCDDTHPCSPTLTCMSGTCVQAGLDGDMCDAAGVTSPMCDLSYGVSCIGGNGATCKPNDRVTAGQPCGSFSGPQRVATCIGGGACIKANAGDKTGVCAAPAADGAACSDDPTVGPPCLPPAKCVAHVCTVPDPRTCKNH